MSCDLAFSHFLHILQLDVRAQRSVKFEYLRRFCRVLREGIGGGLKKEQKRLTRKLMIVNLDLPRICASKRAET